MKQNKRQRWKIHQRKEVGSHIGSLLLAFSIIMAVSLTACNDKKSSKNNIEQETLQLEEEQNDFGIILTGPESYDSADTAILLEKRTAEGTITFLNLVLSKRYTLEYDGTTRFYNKYGEGLSLDQVELGSLVDITFLKGKKHLTTMQLSANTWSLDKVVHFEINPIRSEITVGQETYKLSKDTQILSNDKKIDIMDLNAEDVLSFEGMDNTVFCIRVQKGHGYLRLTNEENFVDGFIEVGQSKIQKITKDMLLTVAEGSYQVAISYQGNGGIKPVVIRRNQETVLDIGDLKVAQPQTGMVLFSINPSWAELYIDGSKTDVSLPVNLTYGLHQLIVKAQGYQSITQYMRVGQASAGIDIVLDTVSEESEKKEEPAGEIDASVDYFKVHIDGPEGAEVYLDGNYIGISPCNFKKQEGAHVITLRKSGYETRSYTIQVDEEQKDISFSFAELVSNNSSSSSQTDMTVAQLLNGILSK